MSRRDRIDEELGLGPRWVRRALPQQAETGEAPGESEFEPPAPEAASAPAPAIASAGTDLAGVRADEILRMDWPQLKASVAVCTACALAPTRNKTVFGVGDEKADWLFVGEGPGADEDARGEPFVGQAGKLLDNMLAAIGLTRAEDVYIANIVKCRPPGNRNPESAEAHACRPYLQRQIELIRPRLIVALGRVAVTNLLETDAAISSLRQRPLDYRGTPVVVTYHPAYLLRNLPDKAKAWEDLCFARDLMSKFKGAPGKV